MIDILEAENAMNTAYKAGNFDAAYARAQEVVDADRTHINGLRHLARIATNRRDVEAAQPAWAALAEADSQAPEPWLQLARISHRAGDIKNCHNYLDHLLLLQPDNVEARTMQVECLLKEKDGKKIHAAFEALCDLEVKSAPRLARIAVNYGMGAEIASTLRRLAAGGDQEAINLCDTMFRAERDAGIGFEIQKNPFSAAKCYRTMRILHPDSDYPTTSLARLRRPFLERARRAYESGEYDRAIEHAFSCSKIEGNEAEPYIISGRAAFAAGDLDKSYDVLKNGLRNSDNDGWLKVNFARAASRQQKFLEAIEAYQDVLKLSDDKSKKYHEEAELEMGRLVARLPQQALRDANSEDFSSAIKAVNFLVEMDTTNEEILRLKKNVANLAQRALRNLYDENDDTAIDLADELIAFDDTLTYPSRVAGRVSYGNGDFLVSQRYWNALTQIESDSVEFWLMRARCGLALKDAADAKIAAKAVLAIDNDHKEAARILKSVT